MLKRNLTINNPMLQKKKPILLKESADDFTPSPLPPLDSDYNSTSNATIGSSSAGTNAGLPSWLGQRPATLAERFQLSINSNSQKNATPEKSNVILNDVLSIKYASAILEVIKRNKQNAGDMVAPVKKPTDSTAFPARPKNGDPNGSRGETTVPANPASVLTDEQSELAAIVDKLPEDFDLSKWDEMTAFQQQNALKKSGLSGVDQMKLLNAPTSIETIATIQDIQANRAQYGITQARADQISSELLKIANARIGVNNRALPFASDFQRNLFLKQLDKEEQKLLESVDGHHIKGSDILAKDQSQIAVSDPKLLIVNNVKDSKLARTAKDILKFYLNGYVINPVSDLVFGAELLGKFIDGGTVNIGVSGTGIAILGGSGNIGLAMDRYGDVGITYSKGGFVGNPSVSIAGFVSVSNASELEELNGISIEAGGSFGVDPSIGLETFTFENENHHKYAGFNFLGGIGVAVGGAEVHSGYMNTTVDYLFNLYDEWRKFLEDYRAW